MEERQHPAARDLPAYLARTGYRGPLEPTLATLEALHAAHAARIPFENLAIQMGQPVCLDLADLQAKLVAGGRGGIHLPAGTRFRALDG